MSLACKGSRQWSQTTVGSKSAPQSRCVRISGGSSRESQRSPQRSMAINGPYRSRPFSVRRYSKRSGKILILAPVEDAVRHQPVEPIGQDIGGDPQLALQLVELANPEERFADHHEAPAVADHLERLRDRARAPAIEHRGIGRSPVSLGVEHRACAGAGTVSVGHRRGRHFLLAVRARRHRAADRAADVVDQVDRRLFRAAQPFVAECEQRQHDRVEVDAHAGEAILGSLRALGILHPAQQALRREHAQPLGQRLARDAERRLKGLEPGRGEVALAQDEKRPAVAQDGDRACHRAVSLMENPRRLRAARPGVALRARLTPEARCLAHCLSRAAAAVLTPRHHT